jgi:hypothetical protein
MGRLPGRAQGDGVRMRERVSYPKIAVWGDPRTAASGTGDGMSADTVMPPLVTTDPEAWLLAVLERCLPCLDAFVGEDICPERDDDRLEHDPALILGRMAAVLGFDDAGAMFHHCCPAYEPEPAHAE